MISRRFASAHTGTRTRDQVYHQAQPPDTRVLTQVYGACGVLPRKKTLTDVTVYYKTQCVYPGSLCSTWCPARHELACGSYAQYLSSACRKLLQTPGNASFHPRPAGRGLSVRRTPGTSRALRRAGNGTRYDGDRVLLEIVR